MGAFLVQPKKKKQSCSGSGTHEHFTYHYGASCMQGWRVAMEDAHSSLPTLEKDTALFAVYDGHGGKEVALYCREKLPEKLKSEPAFTKGKIGEALKKVFLELDDEVRGSAAASEMQELLRKEGSPEGNGIGQSSSDDDEYKPSADEELLLRQEADIPLSDIIAQFGSVSNGESRKSMLQVLFEEGLDESSSDSNEVAPSPGGSDSEITEDETPSSSSCPSPSKSEDIANPASQPKTSDEIPTKSHSELSSQIFALDASSNLEVPTLQHASLPSPIQSPDKVPYPDLSDNPELEETEATLKRELEELDKTPLLAESGSSDEEQEAITGEKKPPYKLSRDNKSEGFDSGTTAVVCVIHKGEVIVANAGDSRCVLSRQGEAYPLSFDHKPTDAGELKRINTAGGKVGPDGRVNSGLNLSRAIGDHIYKKNKDLTLEEQMISALPDIHSTTLQPGDSFILLACDGIFNVMDNQEAITFVQNRLDKVDLSKEGPSALARICEELCDGCLADNTNNDGSGCDNMTAVIVVPETTTMPSSNAGRKRKSSGGAEAPKRLRTGSLDDTC